MYSTTWMRREPAARQAELDDPAALSIVAAVGDPHDPARRDHELGVVDDRLHEPQQRVLLEDRVRVDRADVGMAPPRSRPR